MTAADDLERTPTAGDLLKEADYRARLGYQMARMAYDAFRQLLEVVEWLERPGDLEEHATDEPIWQGYTYHQVAGIDQVSTALRGIAHLVRSEEAIELDPTVGIRRWELLAGRFYLLVGDEVSADELCEDIRHLGSALAVAVTHPES